MNKKSLYKNFITMALSAMVMAPLAGCGDDDLSKRVADYDPRYTGTIETDAADYTIEADQQDIVINFTSDMDWTAQLLDDQGEACTFATVEPTSGVAGENTVTVSIDYNDTFLNDRVAQLQIITEKNGVQTITIEQYARMMDPATIENYEKYTIPGPWNPHFEGGAEAMLRSKNYYSWARSRQSEHFFVFWSPEFGEDPNSEENRAADMWVDVDDLLEKAEKFFDTNVNKLGMATLGQDKSMLDNYKMQIYLIYQEEWLATGSGYDDKIGALWVNPATCHPVGSTIAHEIGHSFQYQTYADRVQCQGVENDYSTGFRYGYLGPDGSGNGGCGYWEQCAQWQAQRDYPEEQFESYNYAVWLANCHRHFHHEWMRYASYFLQSYLVELSGIEAYGRIWTESVYPEDAIMAYTRLYNGGDYATTREQLFDYAMKVTTYDIKDVRDYALPQYQGLYDTKMHYNSETGEYQVAYANCPGATGINIIPLTVPNSGTTVKVAFKGLEYGAKLSSKDKGKVVDGDGVTVGTTDHYNTVGGAENMGWRYAFVAYKESTGQRVYGKIGKDKEGNLSLTVPSNTSHLWLVVQGSPEEYMSHGWDEDEANDAQFPYTIKLTNTDLLNYMEETAPEYTLVDDHNLACKYDFYPKASNPDYAIGQLYLDDTEVLDFLGLTADELLDKFVALGAFETVEPAEGTIVLANLESDGTYCYTGSSNNGFWCNADGDRTTWGDGHKVYSERSGLALDLGHLPNGGNSAGDVVEMRPAVQYMKGGELYTVQYTITYHFK